MPLGSRPERLVGRRVSLVAAPRVVDLVDAHRQRWGDTSTEAAIFGPVNSERCRSRLVSAGVRRCARLSGKAGTFLCCVGRLRWWG